MIEEAGTCSDRRSRFTPRFQEGSHPTNDLSAQLTAITLELLGADTVDEVVRVSLTGCVPRIASWAQLLVAARSGFWCATTGPSRLSAFEVPWPALNGALSGHARVMATGLAEILPPGIHRQPWIAAEPPGADSGAPAAADLLVLPLVAHGASFGTLTLANPAPGLDGFAPTFADELSDRISLALDRARRHSEQAMIAGAVVAGRAASWPPETPGMVLAPRLRRGTRRRDDGGDFLDVTGAPGDWEVLLGDVIPSPAPAPLLSLRAQHVVHGAAHFERRPAGLLCALNSELTKRPQPGDGTGLLSAVCARVQRLPAQRLVVSLASAGHPRPLVVTPGGDIHEIAVHGRFCGALRSTTYMEVQVKLGRGDLLLLVGDGVVDAKGSQGRFGADRLARLAAGYRGAEPAALAAAVDLAVTEYAATCPGEPTGDTAVVVIGAEPG